ncbi:MAG: hypothetical protein ACHQ5A_07015 [Opitutales bacterium]
MSIRLLAMLALSGIICAGSSTTDAPSPPPQSGPASVVVAAPRTWHYLKAPGAFITGTWLSGIFDFTGGSYTPPTHS